jgi:hypothetical protein
MPRITSYGTASARILRRGGVGVGLHPGAERLGTAKRPRSTAIGERERKPA